MTKSLHRLLILTAILLGSSAWASGKVSESNGAAQATFQQAPAVKPIKIRVVDEKSQPIIGAVVVVEGTLGRSSSTDLEGYVTLSAAPGETLSISYMGYKTTPVVVSSQDTYNVTLQEDAVSLEQVVVVGYGVQTKAHLTGSIAQVSGKTLEERPITNIAQGLQGLVPGMTIVAGSGRPGQDGGSIRIRGIGTLNDSNPYILIDGVESGNFNSLDPNDVESISVLKDAASAAIYGSKASNGVILITTKRGRIGKPTVTYNGNAGIQNAANLIERMSSGDYATYYNQALVANGKKARFTEQEVQKLYDGSDPYKYPNTDWTGLAYKTGFLHTHNVNISGGSENVRYMASAGYLGQSGVLPNASRDQFNIRTNIDATFSKHFSARINLAYTNNQYKDPIASYASGGSSYQVIRQLNLISPWVVNRYEDGTYGTIADGNPMAWLDSGSTVKRANHNVSAFGALDYNVIEGLKLTAQGSYATNIQNYTEFVKDIRYNPNKYQGPNSLSERYYTWERFGFDALINFDRRFGDHGIKFLGGYHLESFSSKELIAGRDSFPNNNLTDMSAGTTSTQTNSGYSRQLNMLSFFGRLNYDYKGRYLVDVSFRADASSRFSPETRWGYFPSVSAAWVLSEEPFMEASRSWLNQLKIRGSWGQLGNQNALSTEYYPWQSLYGVTFNALQGGQLLPGTAQNSAAMRSISWETATNYGVGIDLAAFNGLTFSLDWYVRDTEGIIMEVPVPGSYGLTPYKDNVGGMRNEGVEITAGYNKTWGDWNFNVSGNFAYNQNRVTSLGGVNELPNGNYIRKIGHELDSYYTYQVDGIFQTQQEADDYTAKYGNPFGSKKFRAGDFRYHVDPEKGEGAAKGKLTEAQRVILNSTMPKYTFGLNLGGGWKGIDISMMFTGAAGVSRYYDREAIGVFAGDTQHPSTYWLNAWTPENPTSMIPRIAEYDTSPSGPENLSSAWIFNSSYIRMKNLQVGYTFPSAMMAKAKISRFRIYYSAENLFTLSALPINIDPEASAGNGMVYPMLSSHSIGISLSF